MAQMVLGYGPFGELEHLKMKNVLIIEPFIKDAAKAMGFKNAISIAKLPSPSAWIRAQQCICPKQEQAATASCVRT